MEKEAAGARMAADANLGGFAWGSPQAQRTSRITGFAVSRLRTVKYCRDHDLLGSMRNPAINVLDICESLVIENSRKASSSDLAMNVI